MVLCCRPVRDLIHKAEHRHVHRTSHGYRGRPMDAAETSSSETVETDLPDLSSLSLEDLASLDPLTLAPALDALRSQVDRPRTNLGAGGGPPGRFD